MKLVTECIFHNDDWKACSEKRFVKTTQRNSLETDKVRKMKGLCKFSCYLNVNLTLISVLKFSVADYIL